MDSALVEWWKIILCDILLPWKEDTAYLKNNVPFKGEKRVMPFSNEKKKKRNHLPIKEDIQLHIMGLTGGEGFPL